MYRLTFDKLTFDKILIEILLHPLCDLEEKAIFCDDSEGFLNFLLSVLSL